MIKRWKFTVGHCWYFSQHHCRSVSLSVILLVCDVGYISDSAMLVGNSAR